MERLAEIGASLDWEAILEDSRRWGSYGWAITNDQFTYNAPPRCPSSLEEADAVYLSFLDVDALIAGLEGSVAKKVDFREAVELFRERHYKPCAMMLLLAHRPRAIFAHAVGQDEMRGASINKGLGLAS